MNTLPTPSKLDTATPARTDSQIDYILLDASGSMQSKWYETLAAVDAYIAGVKDAGIRSRVILQPFEGDSIDYVAIDSDIAQFPSKLHEHVGSHWRGTPLFDSIQMMAHRLNQTQTSLRTS